MITTSVYESVFIFTCRICFIFLCIIHLDTWSSLTKDALGLELWSMTDEVVFDNFLVTDDREEHTTWVQQTWERKVNAETYSGGAVST